MAKKKLAERLSVATVMITTKAKGLRQLDPNPDHTLQDCWTAEGSVEAFADCTLFIFVTNTSSKRRRFEKHNMLGRPNDDISGIVPTKTTQRSAQNKQLL